MSFLLVNHLFKAVAFWDYLGFFPRICLALPVILGIGCVNFKLIDGDLMLN